MFARLIVAGRLFRDAELRSLASGQVIRFSIPYSPRGSRSQEEGPTLWIECSYWRNPEDSTEVFKHLKKGAVVLVEGTPSIRTYTRNDNTPGVAFECRVTNVRVLVYPPSGEGEKATASPGEEPLPSDESVEPTPPPLPEEEERDLPF